MVVYARAVLAVAFLIYCIWVASADKNSYDQRYLRALVTICGSPFFLALVCAATGYDQEYGQPPRHRSTPVRPEHTLLRKNPHGFVRAA